MNKYFVLPVAFAALSACGGTTTAFNPTRGTPAPPPAASFVGNTGTVNLSQGGGYTFSVPFNGASAAPEATTLAALPPSAPPTVGSTTMNGRFDMVRLTDFAVNSGVPTGTRTNLSGPLTLNVDFATNTITNVGGDLSVNGTYSTQVQNGLTFSQLTGTVGYFGVTGTLNGFAGGKETLGVFQGAQGATAYAGGFSAIE